MKAFLSKWINFLLCGYRAVYILWPFIKTYTYTFAYSNTCIQVNYTPSCLDVKTMSLNPRLCRNRYFPVLGNGNCLDVAEFLVRWRWEQLLESLKTNVKILYKSYLKRICDAYNHIEQRFPFLCWLVFGALFDTRLYIYTVITNLLQYLLIWL